MAYRYLGNKARLADWIAGHVAARLPAGSAVADPMCGTATMSAAFAGRGMRVIASDELSFPVLHARARLLHDGSHDFRPHAGGYADAIAKLNALKPVRGLFWREYSDQGRPANGSRPRRYFTGANAARIDAIRAAIRGWREDGLSALAADLLLHDLILAVNRVANIAGTYGYYRSGWNAASLAPLRLAPTPPRTFGDGHCVTQGKVEEVAGRIRTDALYLDPPYTKRQYGGNYHILETLAREDEPEPKGDGGLRDWTAQASDFCYRRRAARAFRAALDRTRASWVFVSYSEDAQLASAELGALLARYGRVERHERPIERFRSNGRVARQGDVAEHLYVLEMDHAGAAQSRRTLGAADQSQ